MLRFEADFTGRAKRISFVSLNNGFSSVSTPFYSSGDYLACCSTCCVAGLYIPYKASEPVSTPACDGT